MDIRIRVAAIIIKNNEILLIAHKKKNNVYWMLPGGGVKYSESLEHALKSALTLNKDSIRTVQLFAQTLILSGKVEPGVKMLRKILRDDCDWPILLNLKAVALQLLGRSESAFEILKECVSQAPNLLEANLQYARLAIKMEHWEIAERAINI